MNATESTIQSRNAVPVWPGAMLIGLIVTVGLVARFWAWAEITIRIWLFQFILTASGDLLGPQLNFTNIYYQFPMTVMLEAPELVADGDAFMLARRMRLTLGEFPIAGRAIQIAEVRFVHPILRFIWKEDGSLVGLNSGFIKSFEGEQYTDKFSTKPSDFLAIRVIEVENGSLAFEPEQGERIRLDDITMEFNASPSEDSPGLYRLDAQIKREPVLQLELQSALNIDTGDWDIEHFLGDLSVDPSKSDELPADIKTIIERYNIIGDLGLRSSGRVPLADLKNADLELELMLERSNASIGEYRIPIPKLLADMQIKDEAIQLDHMVIDLERNGHMTLTGNLSLKEPRPFDVRFDFTRVHLNSLIEKVSSKSPGYTGFLGSTGEIHSTVKDVLGDLSGRCVMTLEQGDILHVPLVSGLQEAVLGRQEWPMGNDTGSMTVELTPDRAEIDDLVLEGDHMGVRGQGEVYFDGKINFRFNAGPLEKLQINLNEVGDVLGFITDRLVTYQVTGTWNDPHFSARLLGLGTRHRSTRPGN